MDEAGHFKPLNQTIIDVTPSRRYRSRGYLHWKSERDWEEGEAARKAQVPLEGLGWDEEEVFGYRRLDQGRSEWESATLSARSYTLVSGSPFDSPPEESSTSASSSSSDLHGASHRVHLPISFEEDDDNPYGLPKTWPRDEDEATLIDPSPPLKYAASDTSPFEAGSDAMGTQMPMKKGLETAAELQGCAAHERSDRHERRPVVRITPASQLSNLWKLACPIYQKGALIAQFYPRPDRTQTQESFSKSRREITLLQGSKAAAPDPLVKLGKVSDWERVLRILRRLAAERHRFAAYGALQESSITRLQQGAWSIPQVVQPPKASSSVSSTSERAINPAYSTHFPTLASAAKVVQQKAVRQQVGESSQRQAPQQSEKRSALPSRQMPGEVMSIQSESATLPPLAREPVSTNVIDSVQEAPSDYNTFLSALRDAAAMQYCDGWDEWRLPAIPMSRAQTREEDASALPVSGQNSNEVEQQGNEALAHTGNPPMQQLSVREEPTPAREGRTSVTLYSDIPHIYDMPEYISGIWCPVCNVNFRDDASYEHHTAMDVFHWSRAPDLFGDDITQGERNVERFSAPTRIPPVRRAPPVRPRPVGTQTYCQRCRRHFPSTIQLERHLHGSEWHPFYCRSCTIDFPSFGELHIHYVREKRCRPVELDVYMPAGFLQILEEHQTKARYVQPKPQPPPPAQKREGGSATPGSRWWHSRQTELSRPPSPEPLEAFDQSLHEDRTLAAIARLQDMHKPRAMLSNQEVRTAATAKVRRKPATAPLCAICINPLMQASEVLATACGYVNEFDLELGSVRADGCFSVQACLLCYMPAAVLERDPTRMP